MLMPRPIFHTLLTRPSIPLASLAAATTLFFTVSTRSSSSNASASTMPPTYHAEPYTPRHKTWPYSPSDFQRADASSDTSFYSAPRFVTHIDDAAIASLRAYYDASLPRKGRILDFCSSWISHYPASIATAAERGELAVVGMGLNQKELEANEVLNSGRILQDLNVDAEVPVTVCGEAAASGMRDLGGAGGEEGLLDASTCVVSIDYLVRPVEVLQSLLQRTKKGGAVHLIISNRCFPTKAVGRWLRVDEEERLNMVGDYLWFAGWRDIEILDLKGGQEEAGQQTEQGGLGSLMRMMGMRSSDPLWCVRAKKEG